MSRRHQQLQARAAVLDGDRSTGTLSIALCGDTSQADMLMCGIQWDHALLDAWEDDAEIAALRHPLHRVAGREILVRGVRLGWWSVLYQTGRRTRARRVTRQQARAQCMLSVECLEAGIAEYARSVVADAEVE